MSAKDPLHDLFFRYRKRKQSSIDGHTPGLEYPTRHHGSTHVPTTGHAAQHNHGGDYLDGQDGAEYDPGRGFYSSSSPNYYPPAPWHDMHVPPTPELKTPPGAMFPDPPQDDPLADVHALFDPDHHGALEITDIWRRVLARAAYQNSIDVEKLMATVADTLGLSPPSQSLIEQFRESGAPSVEDEESFQEESDFQCPIEPSLSGQPDPLDMQIGDMFSASAGVEIAADQMSLEDIVEQQWQQMDPFAMNDPMQMMAPYDPFPPGPPGMPMDPFGP